MDSIKAEVVVVGAGPGGDAAAGYAADRGNQVLLIEQDKQLGGVCLNRGCIPSKALLHATKLVSETGESAKRGVVFASPKIDLDKLRAWKDSIVHKLGQGVAQIAERRGVRVLHGRGHFEGSQKLRVETEQGQQFVD